MKGEDEICLCQTLDAVKNRHVSSKMFGVCAIRGFYIRVKNIFMSNCWQSGQSYHFAIFCSPIFLFFFSLHEYCCLEVLFLILNKFLVQ